MTLEILIDTSFPDENAYICRNSDHYNYTPKKYSKKKKPKRLKINLKIIRKNKIL